MTCKCILLTFLSFLHDLCYFLLDVEAATFGQLGLFLDYGVIVKIELCHSNSTL